MADNDCDCQTCKHGEKVCRCYECGIEPDGSVREVDCPQGRRGTP